MKLTMLNSIERAIVEPPSRESPTDGLSLRRVYAPMARSENAMGTMRIRTRSLILMMMSQLERFTIQSAKSSAPLLRSMPGTSK